MMKIVMIIASFLLLANNMSGIERKDLPEDSKTILKALNDELNRNMNELEYEGYSKPFFIAYNMSDVKSHQLISSLGSIITSQPEHNRGSSVRLMVGDYDLNDENFSDKTNAGSYHNDGTLPIPLDNNYLGIRRAYWMMTNNVFKSASEKYKNKSEAMARKKLSKNDMEAPDFSRESPQHYYKTPIESEFDVTAIESKARDISSIFCDYPEIIQSKVFVIYQNSTNYFVNSEGTEVVAPKLFYKIAVVAMTYSKENDMIGDFLAYYGNDLNDLPSLEDMKTDARVLAENLIEKSASDPYMESYNGPVLLEGKAVPEIMFQRLFTAGDGLIARRNALVNDTYKGITNSTRRTWEARYGNKVISRELSILDIPSLKSYHNIPLFGNFEIDREGVVPPDSLLLVKNGILLNQLNNRTPTAKQLNSNGHNRHFIGMGASSFAVSPSNVMIKAENTSTYKVLKKQLIESAKDEGLQYALIIKPLDTKGNFSPLNYYKVDVDTGHESLLRSVSARKLSSGNLSNVLGISKKEQVHNTLYSSGSTRSFKQPKLSGVPVSYICPYAILLKDAEIEGINKPIQRDGAILANPVGLSK